MEVVIILPISRDRYLRQVFDSLEMLDTAGLRVSLFTYIDGDLNLFEIGRNKTEMSKFASRLCAYRRKGIAWATNMMDKRKRIAEVHNEIKGHIKDCTHVLLTEDDTLLPPNTLVKLAKTYENHMGVLSGLQIGRHGFLHVGAWKVDDIYNVNQAESLPMQEGVHETDGTGMFCAFTRKDLYINNTYAPFDRVLGPDVDFGINLRKKGYKNYIDYSIVCSHLTPRETIRPVGSTVVQVQFNRNNENRQGWDTKIIDNQLMIN